MTPKEKAKELVEKFGELAYNKIVAQQCALICVDEIIFEHEIFIQEEHDSNRWDYWQYVKQEIEIL